jgi:hypothetical protein
LITISYDEKPGVLALAPKSPDLPPVPGRYPSHTPDYEYERLGTVSLLAGLDLHTGRVREIIRDIRKSSDFVAFLQNLDATYPAGTPIKFSLLLDNRSAHISRETQAQKTPVLGGTPRAEVRAAGNDDSFSQGCLRPRAKLIQTNIGM